MKNKPSPKEIKPEVKEVLKELYKNKKSLNTYVPGIKSTSDMEYKDVSSIGVELV